MQCFYGRHAVSLVAGAGLLAGSACLTAVAQQSEPAGPVLAPPAKNRTAPKPAAAPPTTTTTTTMTTTAGARDETAPLLRVENVWTESRPADAPAATTEDERRREQVGRLVFSRVTIECDGAPLRAVLRELRRALGLNMIVFETRAVGGVLEPGVDGELPIDLALTDTDGFGVLEALAALAGSEATWQVNRGTVEFGPKSVLARAEARRTEVVEVGDLALVPPDYKSCGIGAIGVESYNRLDSDEVLADLVRTISTHCEPTAFEPDPERRHDATALGNRQVLAGNAATPTKSRTRHNPNTNAWRNLDPAIGPVYVHGRWASVQTRDLSLVLAAPDFVLRKVMGYPSPLPPREAVPDGATGEGASAKGASAKGASAKGASAAPATPPRTTTPTAR